MIRRLLLAAALAAGSIGLFAATASAANGNIACVYNHDPLHVGLCISV